MTKLKPNESAERTANGDDLMLSGDLPQSSGKWDPKYVLQEARELLRFYQRDTSKPYTAAVISDCIDVIEGLLAHPAPTDLEITQAEIMAIGDTAVWFKEKGYRKCSEVTSDAWRPIETAPRDGTNILLVDDDDPPMIVIAFWQGKNWLVAWDHQSFGDPTHWMPLPKVPDGAGASPAKPPKCQCGKPDNVSCYNPDCSRPA